MLRIQSRDNQRVKFAKRVRDGRIDDRIFVEGMRLAEEALSSELLIELCFVRDGFGRGDRELGLLERISESRVTTLALSKGIFIEVSDTSNSQGIILICSRPGSTFGDFCERLANSSQTLPLIVVLLEANNPSNVGAVARVVEAAGAQGLIVSSNSADPFSPKSLRASMGSAFRLPVWTGAVENEIFEWAKETGRITSGAVVGEAADYTEMDWKKPRVLLFGPEAHGIGDQVTGIVNEKITIPLAQPVESLNLAVSAGIILFEARRQVQLV